MALRTRGRVVLAVLVVWLGLIHGAHGAEGVPTRVWLDVDVAAGMHERDVDDALAMIQAFHSPELEIVGVSAVYGNSPLRQGLPIAREVLEKFGPEGMEVHAGAANAKMLGERTAAVDAMAAALREGSFVILALGPLTNVATLLKLHPELRGRIDEIVMVAGRRPNQKFTYPEAGGQSFPDFNFENDVEAARIILVSEVRVVFAPWEVSSHVWITQDDLDGLAEASASGAWIAEKSVSWIGFWREGLNLKGFNPFDTLAVAWVTHPGLLEGTEVGAWIEGEADEGNGPEKARWNLFVESGRPAARKALYLHRPKPDFKASLLARLAGSPRN